MSPRKVPTAAPPRVVAAVERLGHDMGREIHELRRNRGWSLRRLAEGSGLAAPTIHGIEAGELGSVDAYVRLAVALGREPRSILADPAPPARTREADAVHAAMGEVEAAPLRAFGHQVLVDEPYQHYQFAGRADVIAIDRERHAMLHLENRTRFPHLQDAAGSYNAKRAYLAGAIARRLGLPPFRTEDHVIVALWSSEVLHALRLRTATFRSLCPDPPEGWSRWWSGGGDAAAGTTSSLVVLDPLPGKRASRRRWVGLDDALRAEPRYRGYADALRALRAAGRA